MKSYAPRRIPSRRSVHFGILSGTTVFLRSRSVAPPSPRHHAFCFCFARFPFSFFGMVVASEVGFLLREKLTEFLVPIRWTRFCQTIFLGIWIWQNRDCIFPPAERGLGNECGRGFCFVLVEVTRKNFFEIV